MHWVPEICVSSGRNLSGAFGFSVASLRFQAYAIACYPMAFLSEGRSQGTMPPSTRRHSEESPVTEERLSRLTESRLMLLCPIPVAPQFIFMSFRL